MEVSVVKLSKRKTIKITYGNAKVQWNEAFQNIKEKYEEEIDVKAN